MTGKFDLVYDENEENGNDEEEETEVRVLFVYLLFCFLTLCALASVSGHILQTVLHTLPKAMTRRLCLTVKSFFSWFLFILFS